MWYDLNKQPTKVLLNWLRATRKFGGSFDLTDNGTIIVTKRQLKEELSKREHIPNKKEAKNMRRQRAKKGR